MDEPVAFWEVLFGAEDLDVPSHEAVGDSSAAVDVCAFHEDAILYLGVPESDIVYDACIWPDVGVGANVIMFADDSGSSDGKPAMDDGASACSNVVCYSCCVFDGSVVVWFEVM